MTFRWMPRQRSWICTSTSNIFANTHKFYSSISTINFLFCRKQWVYCVYTSNVLLEEMFPNPMPLGQWNWRWWWALFDCHSLVRTFDFQPFFLFVILYMNLKKGVEDLCPLPTVDFDHLYGKRALAVTAGIFLIIIKNKLQNQEVKFKCTIRILWMLL